MTQYGFAGLGSVAAGLIGLRSANKQNQQTAAQNALLREKYEWDKQKETPGVVGAQEALKAGSYVDAEGNPISKEAYDALTDEQKKGYQFQSYFQPFQQHNLAQAAQAADVAQNYLADAPTWQQFGQAGARNIYDLTQTDANALADQYNPNTAERAYALAADDINRESDRSRKLASLGQGRFGALSSQAARQAGQIEQQRNRELLKAATQAAIQDEQTAYHRASQELGRQAGLGQTLAGFGGTGLSQAQSAAQLGQGAYQTAIQTPFAPYAQYGQTIGQQSQAQVPQFGQSVDPLASGLGAGLTAWSAFNKN